MNNAVTIRFMVPVALAVALSGLAGCTTTIPAPVESREAGGAPPAAAAPEAPAGFYVVKRGDTFYSIARNAGIDQRDLAAWNSIQDTTKLEVGQRLRLTPPEGAEVAVSRPIEGPAPLDVRPLGAPGAPKAAPLPPAAAEGEILKREPRGGKQPYDEQAWAQAQKGETASPTPPEALAAIRPDAAPEPAAKPEEPQQQAMIDSRLAAVKSEGGLEWSWPAMGKMIAGFNGSRSKGIDLSGKVGDPVYAAAGGKVILVSDKLQAYGNLIVVLHENGMQSVYAHNSKVLVKEQQKVTRGQKIAELGTSGTDRPKLHFEIRQRGTPMDPLKYLPPN